LATASKAILFQTNMASVFIFSFPYVRLLSVFKCHTTLVKY
jgi:hypothetical protein